jgi:hypothetical protein
VGASAAGTAAAEAVCGATAFAGTVSVTLVANSPGSTIMASEGMPDTDVGGVCEFSVLFSFCSKAAGSAVCGWVLSARAEKKLAQRAMHKPTKVVIFMK